MAKVSKRAFLAMLGSTLAGASHAQSGDYPNKPVQIIIDSAAGSTPDVALRFVTERLSQLWGQQVLVVNRPGGSGSIAARAAAEASNDGYTLYQPALSSFVSLNPPAPNVPVQLPKDFLPIGFVAENPMFFAVSPSLGVSSLKELIELAKKKPGEITYASSGVGRLTHLTGELLQKRAGIKLQLVPYTGGVSHGISDVATGRVNLIIEGFSGVAGAARGGQIKLIANAAAKRLPQFPDVPTVAETIPDFHATGWAVVLAPLGTSPAIIKKVAEDLYKVTSDPSLQEKLGTFGSYTRPMMPAEVLTFVHQEQSTWQPVLDQIAKEKR